jgi:flagellar protein FlaJ
MAKQFDEKNLKIKQKGSFKIVSTRESVLKKILKSKSFMREKEFEAHKSQSLRLSVFISLFIWLITGVIEKNILKSGALAVVCAAIIFLALLTSPFFKKKAYSKKVEAELPFFLLQLSTEIKIGKSFFEAMRDCVKKDLEENSAAKEEFAKVMLDIEKGVSFQEALNGISGRIDSLTMRRACSNLSNLQLQGKKDVDGLKKLAQELLLKQKIESREFSNKMVVYALVFVAVSAIVPAMFQSSILIGSYFMNIKFTPEQIFAIIVGGFPLADLGILLLIKAKTPVFLQQ